MRVEAQQCELYGEALDTSRVPALSLWRPWADWVMLGWKPIETRKHRRFQRLGQRPTLLAIHAADKWDDEALNLARPWLSAEKIRKTEEELRVLAIGGKVIGTVMVTGFGELSSVDEAEALIECQSVTRYGLRLEGAKFLEVPFAEKGRQGLFYVDLSRYRIERE